MAKPRPAKAKPSGVTRDMAAAEGFCAIAASCLAHLRANEAPLSQRRHPEALHQSRVAIRKLRAALSIFKPILKKRAVRVARRDLKAAFKVFGRCRDLDVFVAGRPGGARGKRIPPAMDAERRAAYDAAVELVRSADYQGRLEAIDAAIAKGEWLRKPAGPKQGAAAPLIDFAKHSLGRHLKKVVADGAGLAGLDPATRHALRIEVKTLRYASDFFAPLFQGKGAQKHRKAFLHATQELQDRLGVLNDLAIRRELAASIATEASNSAEDANQAARRKENAFAARQMREAEAAYQALIEAGEFWA